jgi:hypothetical protein
MAEVRFIEITSDGHLVYGLTAEGAVYELCSTMEVFNG